MWPTPNEWDAKRGAESPETKAARNAGGLNLVSTVLSWSTPTVSSTDSMRLTKYNQGGTPLPLQVLTASASAWPTPTQQDGENDAGPSQWERNSFPLNVAAITGTSGRRDPAKFNTPGKRRGLCWANVYGITGTAFGRILRRSWEKAHPRQKKLPMPVLNEIWVAQLMGLPDDWLEPLPPTEETD